MRRVLRVRVSAAQPARCCWHDPSAGELDTPTHAATSDSELGVRRRYRDTAGGPGRATPTLRRRGPLSSSHRHHPLARYARARGGPAAQREPGPPRGATPRVRQSGQRPAAVRDRRTPVPAVVLTVERPVVARASSPTVDAPRHLHRTRSFTFADFMDHGDG